MTLPTDDNLVKEYFPVSKVVPAVLDIYKDLLGIELVAVPRDEAVGGITWHDDAELYAVWEAGQAQSGNRDAFLGYMFLDLSPRENKYGHAAVWGLIPGWTDPETKERQFPVVCMVANLSKPTPGRPATMVSPPSPFPPPGLPPLSLSSLSFLCLRPGGKRLTNGTIVVDVETRRRRHVHARARSRVPRIVLQDAVRPLPRHGRLSRLCKLRIFIPDERVKKKVPRVLTTTLYDTHAGRSPLADERELYLDPFDHQTRLVAL